MGRGPIRRPAGRIRRRTVIRGPIRRSARRVERTCGVLAAVAVLAVIVVLALIAVPALIAALSALAVPRNGIQDEPDDGDNLGRALYLGGWGASL